jgi:hypothetical protein
MGRRGLRAGVMTAILVFSTMFVLTPSASALTQRQAGTSYRSMRLPPRCQHPSLGSAQYVRCPYGTQVVLTYAFPGFHLRWARVTCRCSFRGPYTLRWNRHTSILRITATKGTIRSVGLSA